MYLDNLALVKKCYIFYLRYIDYLPIPRMGEEALALWGRFLHYFLCRDGPFSGFLPSGSDEALLKELLDLFPSGIPKRGEKWKRVSGKSSRDYASVLARLFKTSPPECSTNRWYSLGRSAWFYTLMWRFSLFPFAVPTDSSLEYWPDSKFDVHDDTVCTEDVGGRAKSSKRMTATIDFAHSETAGMHLVKAAVCSIPRWQFARALESKIADAKSKIGMTKATHSIVASTKAILSGGDNMAQELISGENDDGLVRMGCAKSLLSSMSYVIYSDGNYRTAAWKTIRQELHFDDAYARMCKPSCCEETGMQKKLSAFLSKRDPISDICRVASARAVFSNAGEVCATSRCSTTITLERLFSESRMAGLKFPYRTLKLSTVVREVALQWARRMHNEAFDSAITNEFGSIAEFKRVAASKRHVFNSWSAFMADMKGMPPQLQKAWATIRGSTKDDYKRNIKSLNKRLQGEGGRDLQRLINLEVKAPWGGEERNIPFKIAEICNHLTMDDALIREMWKRESVAKFVENIESPCEPYQPSYKHLVNEKNVLLEGDRCRRHAALRKSAMKKFSCIRGKIKSRYSAETGLDFGLTDGFIVSGVTKWFDIVLVKKSPEIILAVELFPLTEDLVAHPVFGRYPSLKTSKWIVHDEGPTRKSPCLFKLLDGEPRC